LSNGCDNPVQRRHETNNPKYPKSQNEESSAINHAVRLIHAVCGLAGSPTLLDEIRADLRAEKVRVAIRNRDTGPVFDWLMAGLSYQGISNQVAHDYMERHGRATWRDIDQKLGKDVSCPKLKSYWHFHDCRYDKVSRTCAEPEHIGGCPLPSHDLRNGRLNQTAYSLFLFIRDVADGDLVGWIERQLEAANSPPGPHHHPGWALQPSRPWLDVRRTGCANVPERQRHESQDLGAVHGSGG
jgi:hypothetical protein